MRVKQRSNNKVLINKKGLRSHTLVWSEPGLAIERRGIMAGRIRSLAAGKRSCLWYPPACSWRTSAGLRRSTRSCCRAPGSSRRCACLEQLRAEPGQLLAAAAVRIPAADPPGIAAGSARAARIAARAAHTPRPDVPRRSPDRFVHSCRGTCTSARARDRRSGSGSSKRLRTEG